MGKLNSKDLKSDDLKVTHWIGIVEDSNDPILEGRCKIRVFGKMDQRIKSDDPNSDYILPTSAIPWARPANLATGGSSTGSGAFSVPKIGSYVRVTFDNGNYYSPTYHNSVYPSDELKSEMQNSYQNSHFLIYDTAFGLENNNGEFSNNRAGEGVKIFFTEESGIVLDYITTEGSSKINIKPDNSIEISNPNGDSIIMLNDGNITFNHSAKLTINTQDNTEINCKNILVNCEDAKINCDNTIINHSNSIELGEGASEKLVLGNTFLAFFNTHTHIGNLGAPTSPAMRPMTEKEHLSNKNVKTK